MEDHISTLDADLKSTTTDLFATREQLSYYKSENKELHGEMTVINQVCINIAMYRPFEVIYVNVCSFIALQSVAGGFHRKQRHKH